MRIFSLIVALAAACGPSYGAGALSYTLTGSTVTGTPGDVVELVATLRNVGDATLFVNDLSITFGAPANGYLSYSFLFNTVPGTFLTTDAAWTGAIADITIDPTTPLADYSGTATILGGASQSNFDPQTDGIGSQGFTVSVVGPEPASALLAMLALGGLMATRRSWWTVRMCGVLPLAFLLVSSSTTSFAQDGWTTLFDGTDASNWKIGGNQSSFQLVDHTLQANGPVAHAYYDGPFHNHDFKNFELMVDVKTAPGSNGGVYFHTVFQDAGFPKKGFEVQVNNTHGDVVKTGSLYHVKDILADDIKGITQDNEWFTEHIIVQDNTVTIKLNGKEVVKWTQPAEWNGGREGPGRVISHGTIALQGHDPKSTVQYKNIRIKVLP